MMETEMDRTTCDLEGLAIGVENLSLWAFGSGPIEAPPISSANIPCKIMQDQDV
jgi:hypothetical protein